MFYYLKNVNKLEACKTVEPHTLAIPNIHDLRNYAFLYIYPNNEMDIVLRTPNLAGHYYAINPLIKMSSSLKNYLEGFLDDDVTHYNFDATLVANGVLQIYYSTSNLDDEEAFGYINIPAAPTSFQKDFLRNARAYLAVYEDILVCQYNQEKQDLVSLNELGDGNFLEVLDRIVTNPEKKR